MAKELFVDTITNSAGTGAPNFTNGLTATTLTPSVGIVNPAALGSDAATTLTSTSVRHQIVTPTASRTYTLPTTDVVKGDTFTFTNNAAVNSSNLFLLINSSGANLVRTVYPQTSAVVVALQDTPTTAAHWACTTPAASEWTAFTPTFNSITLGNGTVTGYWRRVGADMEIRATLVWGSTTSSGTSVNLSIPMSLTIDTSVNSSTTLASGWYGNTSMRDASSGELYSGGVYYNSTTALYLNVDYAVTSTFLYAGNRISSTNPVTWAVSDELNAMIKVPISGWTSSKG